MTCVVTSTVPNPQVTGPQLTSDVTEITSVTSEVSWGPVTWGFGTVDVTTQVMSYQRKHIPDFQVIGNEELELPSRTLSTTAVWWTAPESVLEAAGVTAELAPG